MSRRTDADGTKFLLVCPNCWAPVNHTRQLPISRADICRADLGEESTLGPKLPQVMVHMKVGMAHALGPRHLAERCVRSELAL